MKSSRFLHANLFTVTAAVALGLVAATASSRADLYYIGDTAATADVAGGGTFDYGTANFSTTPTGGPGTLFTPGQNADFVGTVGGAVTTNDDLSIGAINFGALAAPFTITSVNDVLLTGGGVANASANLQTYSTSGSLTFTNSATVTNTGGGSVAITGNGTVNFTNTSSAGSAAITNAGTINFVDSSTGGTASISSTGTLDISNHIGNVSVGAVSLGLGNFTNLDVNKLNVTSLSLDANGEISFTLGTPAASNQGQIVSSGAFTNAATNETIDLFAGAGFTAGTYHLITFATGMGTNVNPADFQIGQGIDGFAATFSTDANDLNVTLTAVPEVSSFIIPAFGAAGLFAFRRRMAKGAVLPTVA